MVKTRKVGVKRLSHKSTVNWKVTLTITGVKVEVYAKYCMYWEKLFSSCFYVHLSGYHALFLVDQTRSFSLAKYP